MLSKLVRPSHFTMAQLTSINNIYLHKPNLSKYFGNDVSKVQKEMKIVAKKYAVQQEGLEMLFRYKPQVFIPGSQAKTQIEQKIKLMNSLESKEPIAGVLNELLFDSYHLLLNMTQQDILNFIANLKQYGFDQQRSSALFNNCSNLIHNKFDKIYEERRDILHEYLHLTHEEALQIFLHQPFLLTCSAQRLRQSIVFFMQKQNQVLTRQHIVDLLKNLGEVFLLGIEELTMLYRWLKNWDIEKEELWTILLQHPLLLLNHPGQIFHFKAKMLRQFRFTTTMGQKLLRHYPSSLICSVRALQAKFLNARDRLKITINEGNLQYLTFKYGVNIRPRTQMLIKAKVPYTSEDICDYFSCSQQEFLKKTGIPADKLQQEKMKFSITPELDFPQKKCLKNYPTQEKIFAMSQRYYPKADLLIRKV